MTLQDDNWEIYRTDVTGSEPIRLTDNASNDGLPIWSPDGQQIAFVTDRAGYWAIWVMNWDGSDAQELMVIPGTLDPRMPDEPEYRFRGWQEEPIAWSR